ncbi:MAG TPA: aminopeptidase P family protein [Desulfobulbaceae bacterium]|nr:aminopeptidase P family protein [Desulfobulbaceae bacterium]
MDTGARLAALRSRLRRKKYDALLVTEPYNRRYLSGYTAADHGIDESAGVLLVPALGRPYLLTDSRFLLQAEEEAAGFEVLLYPKGLHALLKKLLPRLGIRELAFESHYTLYSTLQKMEKTLAGVTLAATTGLIERMRVIKSEDEIALLKQSVLRNEQVFELVYNTIEPGMSEREIALALELTMHELGAERPSFETIVAFGGNAARPHAVPGDRILKPGEIVLVDMGLVLNGYCSDMTRTFVAGKPDRTYLERLRVVRRAQLAGTRAIRPGVTCRQVDHAARKIIDEAGYGKYFGHALGHGVGLAVHEEPRLSSRSRRKLRPGMIVTVEPGIYLPDWGGIRLENMVVVRGDGAETFNENQTGLDL